MRMGTASSTLVTEEEEEGEKDPYPEDDVDAVATPLRPAYPPTSQSGPAPSCPASPLATHTLPAAPTFNPVFTPRPARPQKPMVYPWQPPLPPTSVLPFQPALSSPYAQLGYYPVGLALSRVARALEATPPSYLLLPDHPNVLPSPAPPRSPPAPPNTAQARRGSQERPTQYPGCGKTRGGSSLVPGGGLAVGGMGPPHSRPPPHPP